MLKFSINLVENAIKQGFNQKQIIEQEIGEKYKHLTWDFITEEKCLKTLYAYRT